MNQQVTDTASGSCERQRCPTSSQAKLSFLGRESYDSGHEPTSNKLSFNIFQINIEGWISSKKEVLRKIATDKNVMAVLVQVTHENNPQNLKLSGFVRAKHIPHAHHGIVTFVQNSISFTNTGCSTENSPTQWTSIEINNTQIINIYHPLAAELDTL